MLWKEFDNGKASAMAPISDWTSMNRTDHFVQFYESDEFLVNSVAEYFFHGLESDSNCISIATAEHNERIFNGLKTFGIDPGKAVDSGVLIVRDAHESLSKFMRKGSPDAELFEATIGTLVREATAMGSPLRAFGEMVAVLWDDGKYDAAVRLEELWNDLRDERDFSLFCAYPLKGFAKAGLNGQLRQVCDRHTKTIPAESYSALTTTEERLRAIAYLQQKAEQLKAEIVELESRISNRLKTA
jgi:hypothetical protein